MDVSIIPENLVQGTPDEQRVVEDSSDELEYVASEFVEDTQLNVSPLNTPNKSATTEHSSTQ